MWKDIIDHFQTLESRPVERLLLLVAGMLLLWLIEGAIPLISMQYKKNKWHHASINFTFTIIHLIIHTGFAVFIILLSDYCREANFGIVYWLNSSVAMTILISFRSQAVSTCEWCTISFNPPMAGLNLVYLQAICGSLRKQLIRAR